MTIPGTDEAHVGDLLLHAGPANDVATHVLRLLAGETTPPDQVARWCDHGRLYTLRSVLDPDPPAAAALVLVAPHAWSAEIRSLVVTPELRGHGLGRRLLLGIADDLRGAGAQLLVTAVHPGYAGWAVPLRQVGFRPVGAATRVPSSPAAPADARVGAADWLALVL